jgi:phosphoribosylamine--glycine ligase/phosphoribosylformylglycinamidine cyclo-ligase
MASRRVPLRILLVGEGGREHAIAWRLSQSPFVERIYVAPGNAGTAQVPKCSNLGGWEVGNCVGLVETANSLNIHLVVPGPALPIVNGIVGCCRAGES